jgi:hypothetical protein
MRDNSAWADCLYSPSCRYYVFSETQCSGLDIYEFWYIFSVKIELLYFDGCPTHKPTQQALQQILLEEGIESQIQLTAVNTNEEAQRMQFHGSPTIRVNGRELFPAAQRQT